MTKSELITRVAEKVGTTKKEADAIIAATLESITEIVAESGKLALTGFGTFETQERKARSGVNPQTQEKIKIKASRVPKFRAGKNFKEAVASKKSKAKKK